MLPHTSPDLVAVRPLRFPQPHDGPTLDEHLHLQWLLRGPIRDDDGGVFSWHHPEHPGFPYLEAAGLLLSHHAELLRRDALEPSLRKTVRADADRLARWIAGGLDDRGVVRHRGVRYAFDTAITVAAMDRAVALHPALEARTDAQRRGAIDFLGRCVLEGRGQLGAPAGPASRKWSLSFAPHLLKLAAAVGPNLVIPLVPRFITGYWADGWFRAAPGDAAPYPHAHAYALEGLCVLRARGASIPEDVLGEGLDSLIGICDRASTTTDVIAQTLRLALITQRGTRTVEHLTECLDARAVPAGGFRYTAEANADLNSWATVFALQALRWKRLGADARTIA